MRDGKLTILNLDLYDSAIYVYDFEKDIIQKNVEATLVMKLNAESLRL